MSLGAVPSQGAWDHLVRTIENHGCPACKGTKSKLLPATSSHVMRAVPCPWCLGSGKGSVWLAETIKAGS